MISDKNGCYVFAVRAGKGIRPWYVGKTSGRMKTECFTNHKLDHYNKALGNYKRGTPVLFFVVPDGRKRKVAKTTLREMEIWLIKAAADQNFDLCNKQHNRWPKWSIRGVINTGSGKPPQAASTFRKTMGL